MRGVCTGVQYEVWLTVGCVIYFGECPFKLVYAVMQLVQGTLSLVRVAVVGVCRLRVGSVSA